MTTINISLPKNMYKDVKRAVKVRNYTSISEMIRDSLKDSLYKKLTINGFTPEVEDEILAAAAEPDENDIVLETEEDITNYFKYLRKPKKVKKLNGNNKNQRQLRPSI